MSLIIEAGERYYKLMKNWKEEDFDLKDAVLVNVFLIASYLYYHLHESLMRDEDYDRLCHILLLRYDSIKGNDRIWHRDFIDADSLRAGTLFTLKAKDYPTMIADIALYIFRKMGGSIECSD